MNTAVKNNDFRCELNQDLKYLRFQFQKDRHLVTLIDLKGFEILKGYGRNAAEALNDLHNNLI